MNVLQKDIWIPDLTATNSIDEDAIFGGDNLRVYVNHSGNIDWEPGFTFTTSCTVDVTMFPVDYQTCSVTVMPWMTADNEIIINKTEVVTDHLLAPNGQFDIVGSSVTKSKFSIFGNPNNKLTESDFTLELKRKSTFYLLNVVGPIAAISFLCGVSFLVPSESGEKLTVAITVLLSLTVFLGVVDDYLPKTSDSISYFVIYVTLLIGMSFLAVIGNVITLFIHSRSSSATIPRFLKILIIRKYKNAKSEQRSMDKVFPASLRRSSVVSIMTMPVKPSCCDICGINNESVCNHWPEVAKMADKFVFIIFTLTLFGINAGFSFMYM
ncbi:neuronal acetylcholine receptor subunit alpha-7 [Patella vulgata]|uniref:neuronal acetylcholine receptor subunit alpha-7 n=1 Tax=Patella vulgata TaxID=6465 RepID=UPI0021802F47|nr:neuronal acetylcholine receptor subunit alpha-7 [Patella vulgata]